MEEIEKKVLELIVNDVFDREILKEFSRYLSDKNDPRAEIVDIEIELASGNPLNRSELGRKLETLNEQALLEIYDLKEYMFGTLYVDLRYGLIQSVFIDQLYQEYVEVLIHSGHAEYVYDLTLREFNEPPDWLIKLPKLRILDLGNNFLVSFPEEIQLFQNLKRLTMRNNALLILPEWIGELTNLEYLDFDQNYIAQLPESIGRLTKLNTLNINHNELRALPESLVNLTHLQQYDFSKNYISGLPKTLNNQYSKGPQRYRLIQWSGIIMFVAFVFASANLHHFLSYEMVKSAIKHPTSSDEFFAWGLYFSIYATAIASLTGRLINRYKYHRPFNLSLVSFTSIIAFLFLSLLFFTGKEINSTALDYINCILFDNGCIPRAVYRTWIIFGGILLYLSFTIIRLKPMITNRRQLILSSILVFYFLVLTIFSIIIAAMLYQHIILAIFFPLIFVPSYFSILSVIAIRNILDSNKAYIVME
ncbi:hypothetical protein MNBD_GAMMA12-2926 [hydrothermal vent metagenome]|uniref:Disease resistance R13L4/SHOC-2-like LRR domain-containing protein n=1 Tax=hydrothermal vent metagenome TaxID=652676 RepID=A0A3B0Y5D9_9ZZZZ